MSVGQAGVVAVLQKHELLTQLEKHVVARKDNTRRLKLLVYYYFWGKNEIVHELFMLFCIKIFGNLNCICLIFLLQRESQCL